MNVVSMVPSWTEMLLESDINVVGRTRFCIHPEQKVRAIPVVGGTKDLDLKKLGELRADYLILDQEENLAWMKEKSPIPSLVTHVTSVGSVAGEIEKLNSVLKSPGLEQMARRWQAAGKYSFVWNWRQIPGETALIRRDFESYENLVYVIWKKPWMSVSKETFIGSMLELLGAGDFMVSNGKKYPEFDLNSFDLTKTYFLFSSEPFPFHKKIEELKGLGVQGSVVDGEAYSWFGLRALRFLEQHHSSATY